MRLRSLPRWLAPALILLVAIALPRGTPSWLIFAAWLAYVVAAFVAMLGWWRAHRARKGAIAELPEEQ